MTNLNQDQDLTPDQQLAADNQVALTQHCGVVRIGWKHYYVLDTLVTYQEHGKLVTLKDGPTRDACLKAVPWGPTP